MSLCMPVRHPAGFTARTLVTGNDAKSSRRFNCIPQSKPEYQHNGRPPAQVTGGPLVGTNASRDWG
jgi:hypothetical protein